jgi:hypothetical protein
LPETFNPNVQSSTPGGGNQQSALIVAMLGFVLLCSHLYFVHSKPRVPTQSEMEQPSDTLGRAISSRPSTPTTTIKAKTNGQPPESPVRFGWLTVIAKPLYLALRLVYEHGTGNWGWAHLHHRHDVPYSVHNAFARDGSYPATAVCACYASRYGIYAVALRFWAGALLGNRQSDQSPYSAPKEQTKSVVPHLRRSTACLWTQPSRAGLMLAPALWAWIANTAFPCSFPS